MARSTASWLAKRELFARTVTIKVRYSDFTTITRSHTEAPTRDESSLVSRAVALLEKTDAGRRPVRLLGVSVHNLCDVIDPPNGRRRRIAAAFRTTSLTTLRTTNTTPEVGSTGN